MFSQKHELSGVFTLHDVTRCGEATVEAADGVAVRTPAAAWAYAAAFPRKAGALDPESGSFVVEIDATVIAGSVGFGCLTADQRTFLAESVQRKEDGAATVFLRLDSLDPCGWLMVRNCDTAGQPSVVIVRAVRVFQIDADFKRELFIFDHIYKTGGTTFHQSYLRAAFRPDEYVVLRGMPRDNAEDRGRLESMPESEARRLRVVAGHNSGTLRGHFSEARLMTLVRDPAARVISGYLHARFHPDSQAIIGRYIEEHDISLRQFVEADLFASRYEPFVSVHDWQAKTLLGEDLNAVDLARQGTLTEAIARRFWLVGYTEALEMFVFFLHRTEGFPLVLFNNRLVRGPQQRQWAPEDLAAVRRFNGADETVYRAVRKEFDRRVAAIWNNEIEQDYRWYMNQLDLFRRSSGRDPNAMRLLRL